MPQFTPQVTDFEQRVRASFARQTFMTTIGARLVSVEPGVVAIELPFRADLTQQHGFLHAGVVTAIVDNACGYAALSLMAEDAAVLTVEYKINFLAPATGESVIAIGRVIKLGGTITVCTGDVNTVRDGQKKLIATMQATMMGLRDREGLRG